MLPTLDSRARGPILLLCALLYALPIWMAEHLPMQDLPNHLAIVDTLAQEGAPGWDQIFEGRLGLRPYATFYALTLPAAKLLGATTANRLVLSLYVLAFVFGALYLVRSRGTAGGAEGGWPVLLFLPLVYGDVYLVGLTNFLLALPLALVANGLVQRLRESGTRTARRVLLLAVTTVWLFLTHPLALLLSLIPMAGQLWGSPHRRRLALTLIALGPSAALLAHFIAQNAGLGGGGLYWSWGLRASYLLLTPLLFVEAASPPLFAAAAALLASLVVAALYRLYVELRFEPGHRRAFLPAVLLGLLLLYFLAPFAQGATVWLNARVALLFWLVLLSVLAPYLVVSGRERAMALGLAAVVLVAVALGHQRFEREISPLDELVAGSPPGGRLVAVAVDARSEALEPFYVATGQVPFFSLYTHFGAYYHLARGGISPFMTFYAGLPWVPLRLREPLWEQAFAIGDPFQPTVLLRKLPALAGSLDLLLIRGPTPEVETFLSPISRPLGSSGPFALYALEKPSP